MSIEPTMWISGNGVELGLSIPPEGPLLAGQLPTLTLMASLTGGELLRYTYDVTDPETGETISGAARLRIEPLPDPRDAITATEEQPATPVGATVFPSEAELADRIFGPGTAEKLAAREEWMERPSGPPARILVDGPGCTPASVPADPPDPEGCAKCKRPFDPSDTRWDGHARQNEMPFCRGCVSACHDTEIADHWCVIDQWRTDRQ